MCACSVDLLALRRKPRGLDRLLQQRRVLAWKAAPSTERVEAVGEAIFVDEGCERADLFEAIGGRHQDVAIGAQPAPIIKAVLGDEANVGRDQILQPVEDLSGIEVVGVGVAQREIMRADAVVCAVGNADAADISAAPRPSRTTIGRSPSSFVSVSRATMPTRRRSGSAFGGCQPPPSIVSLACSY